MIGMLAFILANVLSYILFSDAPELAGGFRRLGFPFLFWSEGGVGNILQFNHTACWSDIIIALLLSTGAGLYSAKNEIKRARRRRRMSSAVAK